MGNLFSRSRRGNAAPPCHDKLKHAQDAWVAHGIPVATGVMPQETAGETARGKQVTLRITAERRALASCSEHKILAMLSIRAPAAPKASRPPLDLVCCIDKSGSMGGLKMALMKQTLELLVTRSGLTADDRLALVSFDSNVKLELPLKEMNTGGRKHAAGIVQGLQAGSATNLSGGALKAIEVFGEQRDPRLRRRAPPCKRTRAVLLFTDGHANVGIVESDKLVDALTASSRSLVGDLGGEINFFTFGFGADHDEDCLRAIARRQGSGTYYHVQTADDIPSAFADCVGLLTSIVAQNATLSIEAAHGTAVSRVLGMSTNSLHELALGDLFAEDEKDVLVELTLPSLRVPSAAPVTALRATLRAFDVASSAPHVVSATLELARPKQEPADQPVNLALDEQRNRIETAQAMENAARLADAGDVAAGRQVLSGMRRRIALTPSANEQLSNDLARECLKLEAEYEDDNRYRVVGSKKTKMQSTSHFMQRGSHESREGMYASAASRKADLKSKWLEGIPGGSSGRFSNY